MASLIPTPLHYGEYSTVASSDWSCLTTIAVYSLILIDDTPTKQQLTQLDVPDLRLSIRIKDSIDDYNTLGTFLLNDNTGVILKQIENDFKRSNKILDEILDRWVRGEGQIGRERSNTWEKLVEYLRIAKLHALADDIESVLKFCTEKSVESNEKCFIENRVSVHNVDPVFYLACILTLMTIIATTFIIFRFRHKGKMFYNFQRSRIYINISVRIGTCSILELCH